MSVGVQKEWVLTNGIGGYAGSSVTGAHARKHHGYLIASLHPPVERFVILSKINECLIRSSEKIDFTVEQYLAGDGSTAYREGIEYLNSFTYDGLVHFTTKAPEFTMTKTLAFEHGKNTIAVSYDIQNDGEAATLVLTPLFNYRVHHDASTVDTLKFDTTYEQPEIRLVPQQNKDVTIRLFTDDGTVVPCEEKYTTGMQLQKELDVESDALDDNYTPYQIEFPLDAGCRKKISIVCTIEDAYEKDAFATAAAEMARFNALEKKAGYHDELAETLTIAADHFLAYRQSTGLMTVLAGLPWFTDWGRDTMIALTGLTLSTGRYQDARDILTTFARYVHHGMVPNMFPDEGSAPLYNTADASMWYFYAVGKYLDYTGTPEDYAFVQETIYPKLKEIIAAYEHGTDFSIYMEEDGLIHAGSGLDQVTWMDVRVGDWVATPRHGKPVEINALWYHALCLMEEWATRFGEDGSHYAALAAHAKESFTKEFWNEKDGCLYDVVDGLEGDATLRPNQIYAVSLPHRMLDADKEKEIVDKVYEKLYAKTGLRSLSPDDKEYHPTYEGCLDKRDHAYHQGTSWGFLLGGFLTAYVHVYGTSKEVIKQADAMLDATREQFYHGCIGSIAEIFDGDEPHTSRGCYAQAWSVGEILRAYTEDILPYK
ncbi:4-alpha-glucanotransferase [Roseburia sp. AF22-2LB]|nr:4-alpha-glucanotransferase [Roseburia sp. AF22-8AC]RGG43295.1 4-alpha-glucanotransferase [Roseburia sp. AF22-2LB]RGG51927.1 4-alpha-glucanotransferase [Roseburia sp. AF20-18LB]RHQ42533.1 4-alpha-glucanotransferase [Roseburia sp. AF25-18LB]RHQ44014.1 4-alpha-glucanotransferase [Roseburia sp. AF25-25LB]RHQ49169.1 4-alpha-glucanotransferase [Roseburia sp. AF25-15LB]RHQ49443.1 4-alpha-glucanotransferase [Roseburia sp. AF25-13LB]